MSRNHIRLVYETEEVPTPSDEELKEKIKEKFRMADIFYWEDLAQNNWYKLNKDGKGKDEIMIIEEDKKTIPLSNYSRIVRNLGEQRKIRLYVKPDNKQKARNIVEEVKNG